MSTPPPTSETDTVTLQIQGGMDCTCNADLLARKLDALAGVRGGHEITPVTGQARISYDPTIVRVQEIIRTVAETGGMTASQVRSEGGRKSTWWREPQQLALYGSFLTAVIAFVAGYFGTSLTIVNGLYLLAVLIGVYYPARKALIALKNLTPTIHLLMLIGSVGAMALGLWGGEAAVLIIVYSLATSSSPTPWIKPGVRSGRSWRSCRRKRWSGATAARPSVRSRRSASAKS